jgi:hypothetical protein
MKATQLTLATFLFLSAHSSNAHGQPPSRQQINPYPTVSPYLNLARQRGNPAINYYGLVRPQFAFRSAVQQLQQGIQANQDAFVDLETASTGLPATGLGAGFFTHLRYFQSTGGGRMSQQPPASAQPANAPAVPAPRGRGR